MVLVDGLKAQPHYNGSRGTVISYLPDAERYLVKLESGNEVRVGSKNLSQWQEWHSLKADGNAAFREGSYQEAIALYSRAIQKNPTYAPLFVNRAQSHSKLFIKTQESVHQDAVYEDASRATELDGHNVKAWYLLGKCHEPSSLERAKGCYGKALEFCQTEDALYLELFLVYFRTLKQLWMMQNVSRGRELRRVCEAAKANLPNPSDKSLVESLFLPQIEIAEGVREDLPNWAMCPISMCVMRDPVMTPQGQTYDRVWIMRHLAVSQIDPITRQELHDTHLVPNYALRDAILRYLKDKPWCFDE